jgi:membrane-associated phospholipid phosphatase
VVAVALAGGLWAIPFVLLAGLVEWARVGAGIHHPIDVVGSDLCVLVGAAVGVVVARLLGPWLEDRVPWERLPFQAHPLAPTAASAGESAGAPDDRSET